MYIGKPNDFWKKGSKYKGYITFWKHNFLAYVKLFEDGSYEIYSTKKFREKKGGYYAVSYTHLDVYKRQGRMNLSEKA